MSAYCKGFAAFEKGMRQEDCPYPIWGDQRDREVRQLWIEGWCDAKRRQEADYGPQNCIEDTTA